MGAPGQRHGPAAPGFCQPEGRAVFLQIVPVQPDRLAEPAPRIDEKDAQTIAVFAFGANGREQAGLFLQFEKANPALSFLLPPKLGQAVNIAHLVSFPKQFAQSSHFAVDGCIAVTALAERADHRIEHVLGEDTEPVAGQNLAGLAQEGFDIALVRTVVPENPDIARCQLVQRMVPDHAIAGTVRRCVGDVVLKSNREVRVCLFGTHR